MSKTWEIKRGDVFYIYKFGSTTGSEQESGRPAVIVSNDENNKHSATVEVVYLTTKPKTVLPTHVKVKATAVESTVLCEQITSVAIERLGDFIGCCNEAEMEQIDKALAVSIGLDLAEKTEKAEIPEKVAGGGTPINLSVTMPAPASPEHRSDESAELLKVQIERDTYKAMYESLLQRLVPVK